MPSSSLLRAKGLYTFSNYFTSVPEGGMLVADNVVIDRDGIVEPRRGLANYGAVGNSVAYSPQQLLVYKKRILAYLNNSMYFDDGSGNFTPFTSDGTTTATSLPQGSYRVKGIESNGNFYFTSDNGVKKISVLDDSGFSSTPGNVPIITPSGGVRAPDLNPSIDLTTPNGFLTAGNTVSYRIVWAYNDNNNNLVLGYPSFNAQISNTTSSNYGVKITAQVPPELVGAPIGAQYFYQLYRSVITASAPASDELNQVYEAPYDGTSTTITIYDNTPESIRNSGTPLYTNEYSGQGITQANSPPPQCQDIALYKNIAFYANTKEKQSLSFTMQGTDGFNIINNITSITYAGGVSTFNASHNMPAGVHSVVLFYNNSYAAAVYSATFSSGQFTISGVDFSSYTPSLVNIFTSYVDVYYGTNMASSQRFYFVGRSAETTLIVGTTKAATTSNASFTLNSADNAIQYLFWYKINPSDTYTGTVPAGSSVVAIDVTDSSVITAEDMASFTTLALNATGDFYATAVGSNIAIATADSGAVSTGSAAFVVNPGTGWYINQNIDGTGENLTQNFIKLSSYISAGLAIESTSKSLVRVVSSKVPNIDLFYSSDYTALPGSMVATATDYATPEFAFVSDLLKFTDNSNATGNMFNPVFGTTVPSTSAYSQAKTHLNRFYYSKQYEPESVPDLNYIEVGPQDKAILRIVSLRNTLFILKEEAIYSLTGTDSSNFYVTLFDSSTLLVAPDTAQVLNNQIYMLSSQGVATVTETGVGIVSRPLEDVFTRIKNSNFTHYSTASFAAGYESDRAYILFTVYNTSDTYATKAYRYNTFTQGWTSWTMNAVSAVVNPATNVDKLYIGSATDNFVEKERKNLSRTDYADKEYDLELVEGSINGNSIRLSSVSHVSVGDMLVQTQYVTISQFNRLLIKLDIDGGFSPITFANTYSLTAGQSIGRKLYYLTRDMNAVYSGISISSGSNDFATVQTEYNTLVGQLNQSLTPTLYKDYPTSSGTVNEEVLIDAFQYYTNTITADNVSPVLAGPITLYKGIPTQIVWAPLAFGDPSLLKHVREGTFMFEYDALSSATVGYATDLSPNFETITFGLEGDGSFGHNTWNSTVWGGVGSSRPLRTLIPRQKQRCRFIKPQFIHSNAFYKFSVVGLSFVFETSSTRAYR